MGLGWSQVTLIPLAGRLQITFWPSLKGGGAGDVLHLPFLKTYDNLSGWKWGTPVGCSLSSLSPSYLLSFLISSHASSSAPCGGGRMKTTACTDAEFKTTSLLHTYHKDATCAYVLHREKTTPPTLNKTSHRPLSHQTLSCLLLLINHTVMWTLLLKMLKEDSLTSASGYVQGGGGS